LRDQRQRNGLTRGLACTCSVSVSLPFLCTHKSNSSIAIRHCSSFSMCMVGKRPAEGSTRNTSDATVLVRVNVGEPMVSGMTGQSRAGQCSATTSHPCAWSIGFSRSVFPIGHIRQVSVISWLYSSSLLGCRRCRDTYHRSHRRGEM